MLSYWVCDEYAKKFLLCDDGIAYVCACVTLHQVYPLVAIYVRNSKRCQTERKCCFLSTVHGTHRALKLLMCVCVCVCMCNVHRMWEMVGPYAACTLHIVSTETTGIFENNIWNVQLDAAPQFNEQPTKRRRRRRRTRKNSECQPRSFFGISRTLCFTTASYMAYSMITMMTMMMMVGHTRSSSSLDSWPRMFHIISEKMPRKCQSWRFTFEIFLVHSRFLSPRKIRRSFEFLSFKYFLDFNNY